MKKLFLVLILLISLVGCTNENVEINYTNVTSYPVDMSGYKGLNSSEHQFKGITPSELIKVIEEDGSGIFYIGYKDCPNCQVSVKYIEEAAKELGVSVYYLDCYNQIEPLGIMIDEVIEVLKPILRKKDDKETIFTPHLFTLINGEFKDSEIGLLSEDADKNIETYKKMMEPFKGE